MRCVDLDFVENAANFKDNSNSSSVPQNEVPIVALSSAPKSAIIRRVWNVWKANDRAVFDWCLLQRCCLGRIKTKENRYQPQTRAILRTADSHLVVWLNLRCPLFDTVECMNYQWWTSKIQRENISSEHQISFSFSFVSWIEILFALWKEKIFDFITTNPFVSIMETAMILTWTSASILSDGR